MNKKMIKQLSKKEEDLIEAIRNFKASKGWMENPNEFEWLIHRYVDELLFED